MSDATAATAAHPLEPAVAVAPRPYRGSWVNVLTTRIERLPGPVWVVYLSAIAVGVGVQWAFAWTTGLVKPGEFSIAYAYYGMVLPATLWLIHHLDGVARSALRSFQPLLDAESAELRRWEHELTVIPARPAAIATVLIYLLSILYYAADPVASDTVGYTVPMLLFRGVWEGALSALLILLVYHSARQLRLVNRIHARAREISLFEPAPLYAFSTLTSQTAIGLLLLQTPLTLLFPTTSSAFLISVVWVGGVAVVAAAIFVLPLQGMHRRIASEKERLESGVGRRLAATMAEINAAVDERRHADVDVLNKSLSALVSERDLVSKLPTWPWAQGTFWAFASAIALPIALWFVTRLLERVV